MQSLKNLTMLMVTGHAMLQKQSATIRARDVMLSPILTHFFVPSNLERQVYSTTNIIFICMSQRFPHLPNVRLQL